MKKIFFAIFISCIFFSSSFAAPCTKIPCGWLIIKRNQEVKIALQTLYERLNSEISALSQVYTEYENALKKQNLLLEDLQTLSTKNTLLEKEISFLLGVDKEVIGLTIDSVATEKEIDK